MLVIRAAQLNAFCALEDTAYAREMAPRVKENNPDSCVDLGEEELVCTLALAVAKARKYGFKEGFDVQEYFAAMRRFSTRFDEAPTVRDMLTERSLAPCVRIYRVLQLIPEQVANELLALNLLPVGQDTP